MKRILMAVSVLALVSTAACGGTSCDDISNKCGATGAQADAIKQMCDQAQCTGDKQKAIDCVNDLACPVTQEAIDACGATQGCN